MRQCLLCMWWFQIIFKNLQIEFVFSNSHRNMKPQTVVIELSMKSTRISSFESPSKSLFRKSLESWAFRLFNLLDQLSWTQSQTFEDVESHGILAGVEKNGNKVFIGRTVDKLGNFVPAKVVPALRSSFYAFENVEESSSQLEFLNNKADYDWMDFAGDVPSEAAMVSNFCIGRSLYNGNVVVGRVDTKTKMLIGSHDGKTFNLPYFEILVYKSNGRKFLL